MITAARRADLPWLHDSDVEVFGAEAWSDSTWETTLATSSVWLADQCGFCVMRPAGDVCDLDRIAVLPQHRRAGVGAELLQAALDRSMQPRVLLEVRRDNVGAIGLYERFGFTTIDVRAGYYLDGADALVMEWVR